MSNTLFHRALGRFVEARERQARRYINSHLLQYDDATLRSLGTSREQIRREGVSYGNF